MNKLLLVSNHLKGSSKQPAGPPIIFEQHGNAMRIVLNTPKTLNALDMEKVDTLQSSVERWNKDPSLRVAIFSANGGKAFSAGGDLKRVYESLRDSKADPAKLEYLISFFTKAFVLYNTCAKMKPLQVAIWDGIVIGAGAGITLNAPVIIATDHADFSMPEVRIGSIPGIGGGYYFSRMRSYIGQYLALTNSKLKGKEVVKSGLAHFYVRREKLKLLEEDIIKSTTLKTTVEDLRKIVGKYAEDATGLIEHEELIKKAFGQKSLQGIFDELAILQSSDPYAKHLLDIIKVQSPLALRLTFEQLRRGKDISFEDNLRMDHSLTFTAPELNKDFFVGMESVVIAKSGIPTWQHKSISDVDDQLIAKLFEEPPSHLQLVLRD